MASALLGAVTSVVRRLVRTRAACGMLGAGVLLVAPGAAGAQQPAAPVRTDTARAPRPAPTAPPRDVTPATPVRPDTIVRVDSAARRDSAARADSARAATGPRPRSSIAAPTGAPQPPISPKRAFVYSLLVPGLGQSKLERQTVGALFVAVEAGVLAMARKSLVDLRTAKRLRADTVVLSYPLDPETGEPGTPERGPGFYTEDLVSARRLHFEDWIALLLFNHVLAGAEAFVAANLWDLPTQVTAGPGAGGRGTTVAVRVAW